MPTAKSTKNIKITVGKTSKKAPKPKKLKVTVGKTPQFNPLVGVVPANPYNRSIKQGTTRHISLTIKNPKPLCGEYANWGWSASKSEKAHQRPICQKCTTMVEKVTKALAEDPTQTPMEVRLAAGIEGLQEIIAEYGEWVEELEAEDG